MEKEFVLKRTATVFALLMLVWLPATVQSREPTGAQRPNIALILADDLGIGDISAYHKEHIPTPNIDRLGQSGVRFTDAHVSAAVCMPSRAGLITGRQGTRHGSEFNAGPGLSIEEQNIAELLKKVGYSTGAIGKWHLGDTDGRDPLSQGFDEFFGLLGGGASYIDPEHPDAVNGYGAPTTNAQRQGLSGITRGRQKVEEKDYLTDALVREAVDFIDRHQKTQFFLYLAFNAPHSPHQATKKYYDRFSHLNDHRAQTYAGMVSALDDGVGEVLSKLKSSGLEKNTLVVFLSDNGGPDYFKSGPSNEPFNGWKRYHLEGGHRVPFFVSWPGHIEGNRIEKRLTSSLDLFPTFASVAGAEISKDRPIDGVNLLPYLKGEQAEAPHASLFWRAGANFAVRDGKWKLAVINKTTKDAFDEIDKSSGAGLLKNGPYQGVSPLGQHVVLYDLDADPSETKNLASQFPDVVASLRNKFDEWNKNNVPANAKSTRGIPTIVDGEVVQLAF